MQGWVKLHRELIDKPIWLKSTPEQKSILITLLLMANHQENEWEWQGIKFKVKPGQFVTSLEHIAEKSGKGVTVQNVRSSLKKFQNKYQFLTNESTKTGRLITICNWGDYQANEQETNKDTNNELTKNQQRGNKELTPNKNDKKVKNDKKKGGTHLDSQELGQFQDVWLDYLQHRTELKCNGYKSHNSEKIKFNQLLKLSGNKPRMAQGIVNQSRANNWQGLFELKDESYLPEADQKEKPLPKVKDI